MKYYIREVKYQWYNCFHGCVLEKETDWMPEAEAEKLGIVPCDNGLCDCEELERYIEVTL